MLKVILICLALATAATVAALGVRGRISSDRPWDFWNDMNDQPKYKTQESSRFFADGRVNRPIPAGTVPWGYGSRNPDAELALRAEDFYAVARIPVPVDRLLMQRGQYLFNTYCAACHDQTGSGKGITTQYGMINPSSFHLPRLREATDGHFFQVITEGKGLMGPYRDKIKLNDRWAVVAYVRALQRSANPNPTTAPATTTATTAPTPATVPAEAAP